VSLPFASVVSTLQQARAARAERARLRAELDAYSTPAARAELQAILARATPQERAELARRTARPYYAA
jgi:hypothetical protein